MKLSIKYCRIALLGLPLCAAAIAYWVALHEGVFADAGARLEVRAIAHQWWWEFDYPSLGIKSRNELHFPTSSAVRLNLETADIVHSFWMPGLKRAIVLVPGQRRRLIVKIESNGNLYGNCDAGCGCGKVCMRFRVVATAPRDFVRWAALQRSNTAALQASNSPPPPCAFNPKMTMEPGTGDGVKKHLRIRVE